MVPSKYSDIEDAFFFVSSQPLYTNEALLRRDTGEIYYISEYGDSDELPDDAEDQERYIGIPHKNELDLGMRLVQEFMSQRMPDAQDEVAHIFRHKGAYSRFKSLLDTKGMLATWHEYENVRTEEALKQWCKMEGLIIDSSSSKP